MRATLLWAYSMPSRARPSECGSTARRGVVNAVCRAVSSCWWVTLIAPIGCASALVGGPHKACRRIALRWASLLSPTPCCVASPHSDASGADRQADPGEPGRRGGLELALEVASPSAAPGGGVDRGELRFALRPCVVTQAGLCASSGRSEPSWAKCSDCVLAHNRPRQKSTKNSKNSPRKVRRGNGNGS
jgi:hypothetical protein